MKKIISILLVVAIISCLAIPAFAQEPEEPQYGAVKIEYSDSRGSIEKLEVMVLDGYVYANVDSFSSRLGYTWEQNGNVASIYSTTSLGGEQTPALALHFRIGDTTVSYNPLCGIEIAYTAPAPCVQNERGIWVPLSYTLTLLGGSHNIAGDVLVIQMPCHNILSIAALIANNGEELSFDWKDDFGYSEIVTSVMDGAGRVVTLFSGLLEFDGGAWSSFVDWNAFDKKFGKSLAAMLCTNSTDELMKSIEEIELLGDVFDSDGALGSVLQTQKIQIDSDVNAWKTICEEQLEKLKTGSGTLPQYNMAYQQYERATRDQDLFAAVGANDVIYIQEELSAATNVLDKAAKIGHVVSYLEEFQQRDSFQATVLKDYFATRKDTDKLSEATAKAIADYASSNIVEYTAKKFCEEHLLEILVDETGLDALMGAPANILLLAWDIISETVPFYSDGLASVESREISNYAQQVQNDALENVNTLIASMRAGSASLSREECIQLAEYCYVYLKACYIARSSAIESLDNVSEETQDILEGSINKENEINRKISKYLSILSRAEKGNSCYILGFLPENNNELLGMYSDDALLSNVVDVETEFDGDISNIPADAKKITLSRDEQYRINIFLSNFAEQSFCEYWDCEKFETQSAGVGELISFVFWHSWANDETKLRSRQDSSGKIYLTIDEINKDMERFFDRTVTLDDATSSGYHVEGDHIYGHFGSYGPYNYMSVTDAMWQRADGTCIVNFSVYQVNDKYDVGSGLIGDKGVYYLTSEEAATDTGVLYYKSGIAEVKPHLNNGKESYQLISYQLKPNGKSVVSDAYCDVLQIDDFQRPFSCYHIPKVTIPGVDTTTANTEIFNELHSEMREYVYNDPSNPVYTSMTYMWSESKHVISVRVLISYSYTDGVADYTYNFSKETGALLSNQELLNILGITEKRYWELLETATKKEIFDFYQQFQSHSPTKDEIEGILAQNREMCSINATRLCVDANGNLGCMVYIPWTNCDMRMVAATGEGVLYFPNVSCNQKGKHTIVIPTICEDQPTHIMNAYSRVLMQLHKGAEYTLYDINKDGVDELIIGRSEYSVYTFDGEEAVFSGKCHSYYDGLYAYEGNGIITHWGGSGNMRFQYVSLYKLSDGILEDTGEITWGAAGEYDDVYDYLKQCSKITDFYPVTDYSFLKSKLA